MEEGSSLARISNPHLAERKYCAALAIKPSDADAHLRRALAYIALEQVHLALSDLDTAITLDPRSVPAFHARALLRAREGAPGPAIEDLTRALAIAPRARLHLDRAKIYHSQGEALAALLDYGRATELDPNYAAAWYHRGTLHLARQEAGPAWDCLKRVFDRGPPAGDFARMARQALQQLLATPGDGAVPADEIQRLLREIPETGRRRRSISVSGPERRLPHGLLPGIAVVSALLAMLGSLAAFVVTWTSGDPGEILGQAAPIAPPAGEEAPVDGELARPREEAFREASRGAILVSDRLTLTTTDVGGTPRSFHHLALLEYAAGLAAMGPIDSHELFEQKPFGPAKIVQEKLLLALAADAIEDPLGRLGPLLSVFRGRSDSPALQGLLESWLARSCSGHPEDLDSVQALGRWVSPPDSDGSAIGRALAYADWAYRYGSSSDLREALEVARAYLEREPGTTDLSDLAPFSVRREEARILAEMASGRPPGSGEIAARLSASGVATRERYLVAVLESLAGSASAFPEPPPHASVFELARAEPFVLGIFDPLGGEPEAVVRSPAEVASLLQALDPSLRYPLLLAVIDRLIAKWDFASAGALASAFASELGDSPPLAALLRFDEYERCHGVVARLDDTGRE